MVLIALSLIQGLAFSSISFAGEWRGNIAIESRFFLEDADFMQDSEQYSLRFEPEYIHVSDEDSSLFNFRVLLRKDSMDDQRSHFDIRELSWLTYGDDWEFKVGISKVFWGVAESAHLVDIINQTDAVENIDGEDKLGQAMINLTLLRDWGTLDIFILPGFRERTFPGVDGRFRAPIKVDVDNAQYESSSGQERIDGAIRWSHTLGDWDVGIAHFSGTSRSPILVPTLTTEGLVLQPLYNTMDQTSLDIQATLDIVLWKLEVITNSGSDIDRYTAAVGGFEYSFYDVAESGIDVGVIVEYQFDDRHVDVSGFKVQDSLVIGSRFAFNDEQSTEFLIGLSINEDARNQFWNVEASRRLGDSWKITLEARLIRDVDESRPFDSPFFSVRNDSFVMVELARYF
ncbi:MAG: hypothetical protein COA74_02130 [Gammaproteobacteria bacterium]|nr:MAG: hypothetical protein COA74_02130 [Gammaproteobacteria bacterium]